MKFHPAALMLITWAVAFALLLILPFNLVGRTMTLYGYMILGVYLLTFCAGALLASRPRPQIKTNPAISIDWSRTDKVLLTACLVTIVAFALDLQGKNVFDLAGAYAERSDRATNLLNGAASDSTIWFQIGFMLYPAAYVFLVKEIAFNPRPKLWRLGVFAVLPVLLTALSMGGRGPLMFAIIFSACGYLLRQHVFPPQPVMRRTPGTKKTAANAPAKPKVLKLGTGSKIALGGLTALSMVYFIQVFVTRAEGGGGIESMFGRVGLGWGVSFDGHFSSVFYGLFGVEGTYLIFVFAWYAIQGIVMSNEIFTDYDGPMLLGTYGIDLVSALMRRINGDFVGDGFDRLLQMNVYGFVPSAFGSLYIDLKLFGLIPCLIWGWLTGFVYRKIRSGTDPRYLLLSPFIVVGILFSLNNTPIGVSNGLMQHAWLLTAFFLSRKVILRSANQPNAPVARNSAMPARKPAARPNDA